MVTVAVVDWLLFVLGVLVVSLNAASVLFTMVLPRRPSGIERTSLLVNRAVRNTVGAISRLARTYEGKDAILAPTAPLALLAQLLFWAA